MTTERWRLENESGRERIDVAYSNALAFLIDFDINYFFPILRIALVLFLKLKTKARYAININFILLKKISS